MKKYYLQFIFISIFFCAILFIPTTTVKAEAKIILPNPQITISDKLNFKAPEYNSETKKYESMWIADYINFTYQYLIGIVGILATVVMMIGGVIWIGAGGNASRISEAKAWISGALMGLVLALTSYTILYQVNDETVKMKPIAYTQVEPAPPPAETCKAIKETGSSILCKDYLGKGWITKNSSNCEEYESSQHDLCCCKENVPDVPIVQLDKKHTECRIGLSAGAYECVEVLGEGTNECNTAQDCVDNIAGCCLSDDGMHGIYLGNGTCEQITRINCQGTFFANATCSSFWWTLGAIKKCVYPEI